ncbi:MAG: NYN domain-containing protein [Desulfobacterales bacterium]
MALHIIIDGYNLIRQSASLSRLDERDILLGREALVDKLAAYRRIKHHPITVVFDGQNSPAFSQHRRRQKGIGIRFSPKGTSADEVIKRMASDEREKALIVSSDRDIIDYAVACGAATISAQRFETKIEMAGHSDRLDDDTEDNRGWTPTTKKKGPARRLSKKQRRNRIKIKKL